MLWRSEFRNVLARYLRRGILEPDKALVLLDQAEGLMQGMEHVVPSSLVMRCVANSTCSAYDCEFIALAQHLNVPLVTEDKQIVRQFPGVARLMKTFLSC